MVPPSALGSLVLYDTAERCAQRWPFVAEAQAPSRVACRNAITSTAPSSSPELGTPSGPSLSNGAKSTPGSTSASASRRPFCMRVNAVPEKMPLQLDAPIGLENWHAVLCPPVYADSALSSRAQPTIWPGTSSSPFDSSI